MVIPYSRNLLVNPDAETGVLTGWEEIVNVTVVEGGVKGDYCFRFEPVASMQQTASVAGQPPELKFLAKFLPGWDVSSLADVKAEIAVELHYADGTIGRYLIPAKTFIRAIPEFVFLGTRAPEAKAIAIRPEVHHG